MQDAATYNLKDLTQNFWWNDSEFCGKESVVLEKTQESLGLQEDQTSKS